MDKLHQDTVKLLDNETGPVSFRVSIAPAKLAVSGSGTLKTWQGNAWDAGETFSGSSVISAPGHYQITLDSAGYATVQENER